MNSKYAKGLSLLIRIKSGIRQQMGGGAALLLVAWWTSMLVLASS
jgi:hypothetical protein